jgi:hypothetical protein
MTEYGKNFSNHLQKLAELGARKQEIDEQIDKLKKLAAATYEMMDEKEKAAYSEALDEVNKSSQSLTQAVRRVLTRAGREHLTPIQIRDQLARAGYDFHAYQSNPLVSIHSTLNRMKDELEVVVLEEGTKGYRFRRAAARSRSLG